MTSSLTINQDAPLRAGVLKSLLDLLQDLKRDVRTEIHDVDSETLRWSPHPKSNNIGVTVWHIARWFDMFAHQILLGADASEELWRTDGWAARTGYDPRGIGTRGWGVVTGYTIEEVRRVPELTATDLLRYYDSACDALVRTVTELGPHSLDSAPPGFPGELTAYEWLRSLIAGEFTHIGEIRALKALRRNMLSD